MGTGGSLWRIALARRSTKVPVRSNTRRSAKQQVQADGSAVDRRRVQQQPVQYTERCLPARRGEEVSHPHTQLALQFLVGFSKRIIASSSSDLIYLALLGAAKDLNIPPEEAKKMLAAMLEYQKTNSMWPEGFM